MNPGLLEYYNRELSYLRELGAEFAAQYPKVAGRLGMEGTDVADPYVERLLEGFSFLTARIQMKMDAEFPRFSQRLMEVIQPNYLAPMPSMAVVQFQPGMNEGALAKGFRLPRGTLLRGGLAPGEQTRSEFTTGHDLMLWPLRVVSAALTEPPVDLPLARMGLGGRATPVRSALRLRIEVCGGALLSELDLDQLVFFLNGQDVQMTRLLELVAGNCHAVLCHGTQRPTGYLGRLDAGAIRHEGFEAGQALLPADARVFQGYRLLQEYFAFPERFLFFSISGLKPHLQGIAREAETKAFDLTLLLTQSAPELEGVINAEHLALHCAPVINLAPRRADRIVVTPRQYDYHVVVERTRPLDYEVFSVISVTGHASSGQAKEFRPFYRSVSDDDGDYGAYYSLRREPRVLSDAARLSGTRTAYTGGETFLSLVDRQEAPFSDTLRHLSVETLCTNRDLPLLLPRGGGNDLSLRVSAPVTAIRVLKGPSRPRPALADGAATWRLISHLGLNYLDLSDTDAGESARALRELLGVYAASAGPVMARQIAGLRQVQSTPVYRRLSRPGPAQIGRAVKIDLQVDETAFSGASPYVFGAVLNRYFSRHVSINTLTELALSTLQRGEVARWTAQPGSRPVI